MGEAEARAVGAGGSLTVEIGGKQCHAKPLSFKELTEAERECLKAYKTSFLETYASNINLMPKHLRDSMLREKFEEAARWDVDDLPAKFVVDPGRVTVSDKLKKHIVGVLDVDLESKEWKGKSREETEKTFQRLTATALDQGALSEKEYGELTGKKIKKVKVPYVTWWITGSMEGMMVFVWLGFKHEGVTKGQVEEAMAKDLVLITEFALEIERLSSPQLGNG